MNLKLLALAAVAACAAALASCETMSAEECATADWSQLGYRDADGNGQDRFAARAESCADRGLGADADSYRRGWAEGIRSFCQPYRAFSFARNGGSFNGSCPGELDQDFRYAFADGRRVYEVQQDINETRSEISRLEERRHDLDGHLRDAENDLDDATTDEQRRQIHNRIDDLRRERRDVNDDLDVANRDAVRIDRVLSDLRYEIGGRWGAW